MHFPLAVLPARFDIVRLGGQDGDEPEIRVADDLADAFLTGKEDIIVPAFLNPVMLLSQSCDAQRRERLAVSRISPISDLSPANAGNLRKNSINYLFHLPAIVGVLDESFVDFTRIQSVDRVAVDKFLGHRVAALTDYGRHKLSWALSQYFSRPA